MKKMIALVLALMLVLSLVACGNNEPEAPAADAPAAEAGIAGVEDGVLTVGME